MTSALLRRSGALLGFGFALWLAIPGMAAAQVEPASARPARPEWGTTDELVQTIAALGFVPFDDLTGYGWLNESRYHADSTGRMVGRFDAAVDIPAGALVTKLEIEGCNFSPSDVVRAYLYDCGVPEGSCNGLPNNQGVQLAPGSGCWFASSPINLEIDRFNKTQMAVVVLEGNDAATRFRAVRIYYRLQVSPAPATARFNDVPIGHPFFQYVEALAASGITAGCGGGNFCPDAPLTRGQMAVFLSKALGLHRPY